MNTFTLNGKEYRTKAFDFNLICDLEDQGVHMEQAANKPLSMMRAYFGICADLDLEQAGKEIASHMEKGGTMDELGEAMGREIEESDFFRSISQTTPKETGKKPEKEKK